MSAGKTIRERKKGLASSIAARHVRLPWMPDHPGIDFFSPDQWKAIARVLGFSERERDVCRLILEGRTRLEIGAILRKKNGKLLSAETVRVYVDRIFRKALVHDRLGLAMRLVRICREVESG